MPNSTTDTTTATATARITKTLNILNPVIVDPYFDIFNPNHPDYSEDKALDVAFDFYCKINQKIDFNKEKALFSSFECSFLDTGEHDVRIRDFNPPGAEYIALFLHGFNGSGSDSLKLIEGLRATGKWRIIVVDAPLHGCSISKNKLSKLNLAVFTAPNKYLGKKFGRFNLIVGHSLGVVSLTSALRKGELIGDHIGMFAGSSHYGITLGAAISMYKGDIDRLLPRLEKKVAQYNGVSSYDYLYANYSNAINLQHCAESISSCFIVHGKADTLCPAEEADILGNTLKSVNPNCEVVKIITEKDTHGSILKNPVVIGEFLKFCEKIVALKEANQQTHQQEDSSTLVERPVLLRAKF